MWKVLEAIEGIKDASCQGDVLNEAAKFFALLGADHSCFTLFSATHVRLGVHGVSDGLENSWDETNASEHCPCIAQAKNTVDAFCLFDAPAYTLEAQQVFDVMRDRGVKDAIIVPVHNPIGASGKAYVGSFCSDDLRKHLSLIQFVGTNTFYRLHQLACLNDELHCNIELSRREGEILTWSAAGKTSWEIGEILSLSQRTVEWHIGQAMHKLKAVNRCHAVAVAMGNGLITI